MAMHMFVSKKVIILIVVAAGAVIIAGALGLFDLRTATTAIQVQTSNIATKAEEVAKGIPNAANVDIAATGDTIKNAAACRENLTRIETAKRTIAQRSGLTTSEVSANAILKELGGRAPVCPSGGKYILGNNQVVARCSIGGNNTVDPSDDHLIQKF
ncbi:MAG TPA: hypothetical protein PKH51_04700 [Candidatus Sumerlaeota bacterium]|nr:hypothetical protein [Candidatus Sumerlaeota bacterium]